MFIFVIAGIVFAIGVIVFVHKSSFGKSWADEKIKIDEYTPDDEKVEVPKTVEEQEELKQSISQRRKELFKNLSSNEQKLIDDYMKEQMSKSPEQLRKEAKEYEEKKLDYFIYALVAFLAICMLHYYFGGFEKILDAVHKLFGGK